VARTLTDLQIGNCTMLLFLDSRYLRDLERRSLVDLMAQAQRERSSTVGEDSSIKASPRESDISETAVDEVRMDSMIYIHQDAVSGESLGTVAGDSIAMIEMS
jgi:hypothetical protein